MAIISRGGRVIDPYGGQADGMGAAMQGLAQAANLRQMQQQRTLEQIAPIAQDLIQRFGVEQARVMNPGVMQAYEGIVGSLGDAQATAQQMANIQMEQLAQGALSGGVPTSTPINIQEQEAAEAPAQQQQPPAGTTVSDVGTGSATLAPQMPTGGFATGAVDGAVAPPVAPPAPPAAARQLTPEEEALLQQQATDVGLGGGDVAARPPAPPISEASRVANTLPSTFVTPVEGEATRREIEPGSVRTRIFELAEEERILREQLSAGQAPENWRELLSQVEEERIAIDPSYMPTGVPVSDFSPEGTRQPQGERSRSGFASGAPTGEGLTEEQRARLEQARDRMITSPYGVPAAPARSMTREELMQMGRENLQREREALREAAQVGRQRTVQQTGFEQIARETGQLDDTQRTPSPRGQQLTEDVPTATQQQEESYYDFTNRVISNANLREGMDSIQSANAITLESFGLPSNAINTILSTRGTDAYTQPSEALGGRTPYEVDWMRQGVIAQLQGTTVLQPNADGSLPPYQAQMNFMRSSTPQDARAIAAVATTGDTEAALEPTEEAPSPAFRENLITAIPEETRESVDDLLSRVDASYDGTPEDIARMINFDFDNPLEERLGRMPAPAARAIRTRVNREIETRGEQFTDNIRTVLRRSSEGNQPGALAVSGQMAEENTAFLGRSYQTAGGPLLGNIDNARQHMDQLVNFMNEYPEVFRDNLAVRQAVANIEQVEAQTRTMEANLIPHLVFYYGQDEVPGIREEAVRHMEGMRNLEFGITEVQFLQLYDQWQFNRYMMNNPQVGGDPKIQLEVLQAITRILESESNTDRQQELIAPFVMLLNNLGTNMFFETQRNEAFLPRNRRTFLQGIDMAQMQQMQQQMQQETDAARMSIANQALGLGQLPILGATQQ